MKKESEISQVLGKIEVSKNHLGHYYFLFMFLFRTGCRISEALNIISDDISIEGRVLIKGLKGSQDRVVDVVECVHWFLKVKNVYVTPFQHCNRFSAYRHLQNLGIGKLKKGRMKESVTHVFRDYYVQDLRTTKADPATLSRSIGHKSTKSTEYYGRN